MEANSLLQDRAGVRRIRPVWLLILAAASTARCYSLSRVDSCFSELCLTGDDCPSAASLAAPRPRGVPLLFSMEGSLGMVDCRQARERMCEQAACQGNASGAVQMHQASSRAIGCPLMLPVRQHVL
jgi:hypothetical protein